MAGTKGKGSTCAFIESLMRAHGRSTKRPLKTGLYTSPHLIKPEERIRINSKPLEPGLFAKYLYEVYDRLPQLARDYDGSKPLLERGPRYLQLFALLAFHVFIRERVDVAIIETHSGGEYDATNVMQQPVVTAITTLGMDHIDMLGPTVENIAWHKAGIFKTGAVALSTVQDSGLEQVLEQRAAEKGVPLTIVDGDASLSMSTTQLKPAVQRKNASLAIAACIAWLRRTASTLSTLSREAIQEGIANWSWPGRFQTISDGKCTWFLDAAHNDMSVKLATQWFAESSVELSPSAKKILVFTHVNELRDAEALLRTLAQALRDAQVRFDAVFFTTYHATQAAAEKEQASVPSSWRQIWTEVFPHSQVHERVSIDAAMQFAKDLAAVQRAHILVTGSQHLVGPALEILSGPRTQGLAC